MVEAGEDVSRLAPGGLLVVTVMECVGLRSMDLSEWARKSIRESARWGAREAHIDEAADAQSTMESARVV